jgi:hypothetical protein
MEHSPPWEARSHSVKKYHKFCGNLKVCFRFHKSWPIVPVLSHVVHPVHNPRHHFSKIDFNVIILSTLDLPSGPSVQAFKPKYCKHSSPLQSVLHDPLISSPMMWLFEWCFVKRTSYEAPHFAVFSGFLLLPSSWVRIFPPAPYF